MRIERDGSLRRSVWPSTGADEGSTAPTVAGNPPAVEAPTRVPTATGAIPRGILQIARECAGCERPAQRFRAFIGLGSDDDYCNPVFETGFHQRPARGLTACPPNLDGLGCSGRSTSAPEPLQRGTQDPVMRLQKCAPSKAQDLRADGIDTAGSTA